MIENTNDDNCNLSLGCINLNKYFDGSMFIQEHKPIKIFKQKWKDKGKEEEKEVLLQRSLLFNNDVQSTNGSANQTEYALFSRTSTSFFQ